MVRSSVVFANCDHHGLLYKSASSFGGFTEKSRSLFHWPFKIHEDMSQHIFFTHCTVSLHEIQPHSIDAQIIFTAVEAM